MSFEVNKGKIFIYTIPIIILILIIYLISYRDGDLDDKLPEDSKSDIIIEELEEEKEIEKSEDKEFIKINKEEKMENLEIGKKYTTDSGLMYEVINLGKGEKPEASNIVEVHYHGTLEDGTVFDSSVERGQKIEFGLNQVISGWTEGLQLMPKGSKFKFTIPSNLAYGDASPSPLIPGGATLIFEVELFNIK